MFARRQCKGTYRRSQTRRTCMCMQFECTSATLCCRIKPAIEGRGNCSQTFSHKASTAALVCCHASCNSCKLQNMSDWPQGKFPNDTWCEPNGHYQAFERNPSLPSTLNSIAVVCHYRGACCQGKFLNSTWCDLTACLPAGFQTNAACCYAKRRLRQQDMAQAVKAKDRNGNRTCYIAWCLNIKKACI